MRLPHLLDLTADEDDTLFLLLQSLHRFLMACQDDPELIARHPELHTTVEPGQPPLPPPIPRRRAIRPAERDAPR
ncbi:hypothetical protein AB0D49_14040 [Streptomyces sp. NPDC048290]|uniref:hypothetical protein n=1 Tax=Streptomyces sp. NPDC048290 TaxID=3155811 RepID=UPI00344AF2FE